MQAQAVGGHVSEWRITVTRVRKWVKTVCHLKLPLFHASSLQCTTFFVAFRLCYRFVFVSLIAVPNPVSTRGVLLFSCIQARQCYFVLLLQHGCLHVCLFVFMHSICCFCRSTLQLKTTHRIAHVFGGDFNSLIPCFGACNAGFVRVAMPFFFSPWHFLNTCDLCKLLCSARWQKKAFFLKMGIRLVVGVLLHSYFRVPVIGAKLLCSARWPQKV